MRNSGIYWSALCLTVGALACENEPGRGTDVSTPKPLVEAVERVSPGAAAALPKPAPRDEPVKEAREAKAHFVSAKGVDLRGEAEFEETVDGVKIEIALDAGPAGIKGMHIHEKPDCSDIPGKSMGSHFAPDHKEHGLPESEMRHLGDLGNITIDATGAGKVTLTVKGANLRPGDTHSFLGRSIVIHASKDLGPGDPSGKSGQPIACGIIEAGD